MKKKNNKYVQCGFKRRAENGYYEYHLAWIPIQFAVLGRILDFGQQRESQGWTVISVGKLERERDEIDKSRVEFGSIAQL